MNDAPLSGGHLVKFNLIAAGRDLVRSAVSALGDKFLAATSIASCVKHYPLSIPLSLESCLKAEKLQGVNRLATPSDQKTEVTFTFNRSGDDVLVFNDVNIAFKLELVQDPLDYFPDAFCGVFRPGTCFHGLSLRPDYRRRFFCFGGFGGGLTAATSAGVGISGTGMNLLTANCWPIVQKLVVIQ